MDIRDLRTQIDEWVSRSFQGGTYADGGGQRLVYHIPTESAALKTWVTSDAAQHERHVREVSALERINHPHLPHVVAPVAQIEIEGLILAFYLEQWLDAPALKSQIADLPLDGDRFRRVALAVADAMRALHDANIVHRDISLGNVLAGSDSGFLIDLGLAKHLDLESLTRAGEQLPRTEITASPEQLQGASGDSSLTYGCLFTWGCVRCRAHGDAPVYRAWRADRTWHSRAPPAIARRAASPGQCVGGTDRPNARPRNDVPTGGWSRAGESVVIALHGSWASTLCSDLVHELDLGVGFVPPRESSHASMSGRVGSFAGRGRFVDFQWYRDAAFEPDWIQETYGARSALRSSTTHRSMFFRRVATDFPDGPIVAVSGNVNDGRRSREYARELVQIRDAEFSGRPVMASFVLDRQGLTDHSILADLNPLPRGVDGVALSIQDAAIYPSVWAYDDWYGWLRLIRGFVEAGYDVILPYSDLRGLVS